MSPERGFHETPTPTASKGTLWCHGSAVSALISIAKKVIGNVLWPRFRIYMEWSDSISHLIVLETVGFIRHVFWKKDKVTFARRSIGAFSQKPNRRLHCAHRIRSNFTPKLDAFITNNFWQRNFTFDPAGGQNDGIPMTKMPAEVCKGPNIALQDAKSIRSCPKWSKIPPIKGIQKSRSSIALRTDTQKNKTYVCITRSRADPHST